MTRASRSTSATRTCLSGLALVSALGWSALLGGSPCLVVAAPVSVPQEIQAAYDNKQFQQVIDEVGKLTPSRRTGPDVRRMVIRSFLKLGNPKAALGEYDEFHASVKHDDPPLLHEVALGFILVLLKDMREQMRGVAYTALKEFD